MRNIKILPCPFGQVVVEARKKQKISRYKLAQMIGRTPQQLAKIEKGENEPVISTIVGIAYALGLDPCELFSETVKLLPLPEVRKETGGDNDASFESEKNVH